MTEQKRDKYSKLPDLMDDLKPHDHLCLIYESREEWLETVVPFILSGLERGEKCIYIVDATTAREVKTIFKEKGLAVDESESKGQLSVVHERDTYTREGFFDPDLIIAFLIEETEKALREGYSALRVTGEMSWVLRGYSGAERVLEYEAKLNKDLFPMYPCVALCQYDRWKFDPETIKGVVLTHPLLIRGGQIYRNFYYIEPEEYLNHKKGEREVQHWLNNLERERKSRESLQESEEKYHSLFEQFTTGIYLHDFEGKIIDVNYEGCVQLGYTKEELLELTVFDFHPQHKDGINLPKEDILNHWAKWDFDEKHVLEAEHQRKDGTIFPVQVTTGTVQYGGKKMLLAMVQDITERKQAEEALKRIEWMLDPGKNRSFEEIKNIPVQPYGSLTDLGPPGLIQKAVGEEVLTEIAADYLNLLETSTAVYEANGNYAFGIFSSGWCRFLDNASRELCGTDDNDEALRCGKWLCHESCWTNTSQKAVETRQPVDSPCHGGLRLYAVPIWANQEVVGAINFGYGDPPREQSKLQEIADKYCVDLNTLAEKARAYESRPPFMIELAKDRLHGSAKLIGALVERKQSEKRLQEINESLNFYRLAVNSMDDYKIAVVDNNYRYKAVSKQYMEGYNLSRAEIEGKTVADLMGQETFEQAVKTPLNRALKGEVVTYQDWFEIPTKGQRYTEVTYYPIFGENEHVYAVAAIIQDITALKLAEEEKQETYSRLKALLDNSPSPIIVFDDNGTYMEISNHAAKIIGLPAEEIYGKTVDDLLPKETADEFMQTVNQLKRERRLIKKVDVIKVDGEDRVFESRLFPISTEDKRTDLFGSIAIDITERKQAEEVLQERLSELEKLSKISSTIRTAETLDEMLSTLLDEILKTLDTDTGAIWLKHPSTESLQFIKTRGWVENLAEEDFIPDREQGIIGQVFRTSEPYISSDIAADPLLKPVAGARVPRGRSGIFVPLLIENEPVGVLFVSMKLPRMIKTEEKNLLILLAEMAGTAIHRLNLHEETLRQLRWLEATNAVDIAISSSQDLRLTLNILLNHVLTQLGANAACVHLYNDKSKTLSYATGRGFKSKTIEGKEFKLNESCPGKATLERQIYKRRIEDIDPADDELWASILKAENFTAFICVPLIAKGEIKGVLSSFYRQPFSEDPGWFNFMEALALQAAIAIDNLSLYEDLQRSNQELETAYDTIIEGWGQAMELRDHETEGHTHRVADITIKLARVMGMKEEKLVNIRRGALLHDIGKIGIPDAILFKPGKLTKDEWEVMLRHPVMAYKMLSSIEYLRPALNIPYYHHEKYDGSGYPQGLKEDEIPLEARIFAVIDVYDALTSDRPYRKAWSKGKAIAYIKEQSGKHFDPQVVEVFLDLINEIDWREA
ncbi:MAG: PAS domain S-box protein [Bacillota bacterium]